MQRLRILTWHVHGSYLYYLSNIGHDIYLPVKAGRPEGYGGRTPSFEWPENVYEIDAEDVASHEFDVVLYQSHRNWLTDQYDILSPAQRELPRIFLEHDPPREHPTDTRHPVDDGAVLLVHVTAFNQLMWDNGRTPSRVIEHGVTVPPSVRYSGEIERGIAVVNGMPSRGRRLGADVFERARVAIPLDLVGMGSDAAGGLGAVPLVELAQFEARYRFFFNPIRYTSLGLSVCEAMMLGMPVVALATTEMATVIENGVNGYADTRIERLIDAMRELLADPYEAYRLGQGARRTARERFGIERFVAEWHAALEAVTSARRAAEPVAAATGGAS